MPSLLHMRSLSRLSLDAVLNFTPNSIHHVKQLHAHFITNAITSPSLLAKLIHHYCAFSSPHSAYTFFLHLPSPNIFLFNTLIKCLPPRTSILVFADWFSRESLVFDDFTYIFALGACARSPSLWEGKQIHARTLKQGVWSNVLVGTTAIHFYANNKEAGFARLVFDEMPDRSSVTWSAMIAGYCSQKGSVMCYAHDALVLFRAMLVEACGVKPSGTTMVCVLSAASQLGVLETGVCVHGYIEKTKLAPENDVFVGTGLVDMYSKCGCLGSALCIFGRMRERNVLTWTAMIAGLARHGRGKEALELLDEMVAAHGVKPNAVTFTGLFSACCHAGLVKEGLQLFHSMQSKFRVMPRMQHYGCIVDLLGRAGHLKEACEFIKGMPVQPDAILWRGLLGACKVHGDVAMGEEVGKLLLQLLPQQSFADLVAASEDFIALSNVYASAERWEDVETVREAMKVKGMETKPGCSSIQTIGQSFSMNEL